MLSPDRRVGICDRTPVLRKVVGRREGESWYNKMLLNMGMFLGSTSCSRVRPRGRVVSQALFVGENKVISLAWRASNKPEAFQRDKVMERSSKLRV